MKKNIRDESDLLLSRATGATAIYVIVVGLLSIVIVRYSGWDSITHNSLGDYLAGVFSPLAFFWFVVTVLLQQYELKETRRVLMQTADAQSQAAQHGDAQLKILQRNFEISELQSAHSRLRAKMQRLMLASFDFTVINDSEGNEIPEDAFDEEKPDESSMREPFKGFLFAYTDSEKAAVMEGSDFSNAANAWNDEHRGSHGEIWKCIAASNSPDKMNRWFEKLQALHDEHDRYFEAAKRLNYPEYERECVHLGLYSFFRAADTLKSEFHEMHPELDVEEVEPVEGESEA